MDFFSSFIENFYLPNKAKLSRDADKYIQDKHSPLPQVYKPSADGKTLVRMINAVNAECGKLVYKLDPLGGLTDFYNHPEFTEWRHQNQKFDEPCDCLPYYQKVISRSGNIQAGDLKIGDEVLSYNFENQAYEFKRITKIWDSGLKPIYRVHFKNGTSIDASNEHRIFVKTAKKNFKPVYSDVPVHQIALENSGKEKVKSVFAKHTPYDIVDIDRLTVGLCFVIGHYLAEGFTGQYSVRSSGDEIPEYIIPILEDHGIPFSVHHENEARTTTVTFLDSWFKKYLKPMLVNSFEMNLPAELRFLPAEKLQAIMNGLLLGDGHIRKTKTRSSKELKREYIINGNDLSNRKEYNTSCKQLADFMYDISLKIGKPIHLSWVDNHGGVGDKPICRITDYKNATFKRDYGYNGVSQLSVKKIESLDAECRMLDFEVEDNHNYFASNGVLLHNCDDFAVYAVALFRKCGITDRAWVWNLIINPGNQITQAWANHVICGVSYTNPQGDEWIAVIDTNSAARGKVFWFQGDKEETRGKILEHFSNLYKVNYYKLIDVPFPF